MNESVRIHREIGLGSSSSSLIRKSLTSGFCFYCVLYDSAAREKEKEREMCLC